VGGILALIVTRQWFVGLLLLFFGWPLENAAAQSHRMVRHEALQGITAGDIMTGESPFITPQLSLGQLARDYILVTGQRYFVVVDGAKLQGVVTMRNIKPIPKKHWDSTRIDEIMTPASELKTAHPQQSAAILLEQMNELGIGQMPVLAGDEVIGIVDRDSLMRLVKSRAELGI
jgi:CBS domain-containing protein